MALATEKTPLEAYDIRDLHTLSDREIVTFIDRILANECWCVANLNPLLRAT